MESNILPRNLTIKISASKVKMGEREEGRRCSKFRRMDKIIEIEKDNFTNTILCIKIFPSEYIVQSKETMVEEVHFLEEMPKSIK